MCLTTTAGTSSGMLGDSRNVLRCVRCQQPERLRCPRCHWDLGKHDVARASNTRKPDASRLCPFTARFRSPSPRCSGSIAFLSPCLNDRGLPPSRTPGLTCDQHRFKTDVDLRESDHVSPPAAPFGRCTTRVPTLRLPRTLGAAESPSGVRAPALLTRSRKAAEPRYRFLTASTASSMGGTSNQPVPV